MVLVLVLTFLLSMLAMSMLSVTDTEYKTSVNQQDSMRALSDTDSAITEVLWRLNLTPGTGAPPAGSRISVNSLSGYDASFQVDPWRLLSNNVDDDLDGTTDEIDELNFNRDWQVTVLLSQTDPNPGPPWEVIDTLPTLGPLYGSKLVVPTIQPQAIWKDYSTPMLVAPQQMLTVRFKLDTDTPLGDSEGDGPEIVFYDPFLVRNHVDDKNTLTGLGGDGNPANDSAYNITWSNGIDTYPASGMPVLLVNAPAKVFRGPRPSAVRRVTAEIRQPVREVNGKAVCGCSDVRFSGNPTTDSYSASQGPYGGTNVYNGGDVGSNGTLELKGNINGDAEAGVDIIDAQYVTLNSYAGRNISGNGGGDEFPNLDPAPQPCVCDIGVTAMVNAAKTSNDNATLPALCAGPFLNLAGGSTCTLNCGTYYYNRIKLTGNAQVVIGDTSCGPVTIYCDGPIDVGGTGFVNGGDPKDLQIISSAVYPTQVNYGGTADFYGVIYAPLAEVVLSGNMAIYGSVTGDRFKNINGNPEIHYDEDLGALWRVPTRYSVVAWNEAP